MTDDRVTRRTVLSTIGTALLGVSAGCAHPLPPPQGVVLRTGIIGVYDDLTVPLLTVSDGSITVRDKLLMTVLPRPDEPANTTIMRPLHMELKQRYAAIYYYVDIRQLDPRGPLIDTSHGEGPSAQPLGASRRYELDRRAFGKLLVGDRIEYNLDLFDGTHITAITTIIRRGVVTEKRPSSDRNQNTLPYRITVDHGGKSDDRPFTQTYFAKRDVYETAPVGSTAWFDVNFADRKRPTIHSFPPNPYGSI